MKTDESRSAEDLQAEYYARTASSYRALHENEDSPHDRALQVIAPLLETLGANSLLDVGAGTGRALRYLSAQRSSLQLHGIEPSAALIQEAEGSGVPTGVIQQGSGEALPFADSSIDVVTAFGVLHHVRHPSRVIQEMLRVARSAVFISDGNRFAQGRPLARRVKLALHALGLWPMFDLIRTRGRGYMVSEGDGLFYSYSVFDSIPQLRSWSPELMFFELDTTKPLMGRWTDPLGNASSLLIGAFKRFPLPSLRTAPVEGREQAQM